jgi:hypothetical protein
MLKFQEEHHLCKVMGYADGTADKASWYFVVDDWKTKVQISIQNKSVNEISKLFQKAHVKDNASEPRSFRGTTYRQIVQDILNGVDRMSWIWSNHLQLLYAVAKSMGAVISGGR